MLITITEDIIVEDLTADEKHKLKNLMSFTNPAWSDAIQFGRSTWKLKKDIRLYEEQGNTIHLPRGSLYKLVQCLGIPSDLKVRTASFEKTNITSKIVLRDLQKPWVESLLSHKQGIGVAAAGVGKTVMALHVIATIGQPTLWLTHRQSLVNQFKERAGFFIGATDIGTIGSGKFEIGPFLTAGMVQTIARRDVKDFAQKFGVIVVDECHITPALQTMKAIRQFAPEYLYGLTATPYREDRLERVMYDTIGPLIAYMDRDAAIEAQDIMPANVKVRKTGINYPGRGPHSHDFSKVMDYLIKHEGRNKTIAQDILTEVAYGNICIALTSRIEHGAILKKLLTEYGIDCEHLHSNQSGKQREKKLERFLSGEISLLLATYQLLSDGFDHKPTNRIFFTLPYKSKGLIEQSKGRIERTCEGKEDALVYDYVDDVPMLEKQFAKRCEQYQEHNLDIIF